MATASTSGTHRVRAWLATRSLPWFAVGLVLTVGGVVVLAAAAREDREMHYEAPPNWK